MASELIQKPHAMCIPYPAQGHINPMLNMAKLLHDKGFHITFVNTECKHRRLLKSIAPHSLDGFPDFCYETIPDDINVQSPTTSIPQFRELLNKLNDPVLSSVSPVTCVISDDFMSFAIEVAEKLKVPKVLFWTASACGFLAYTKYKDLVGKGLVPLKDIVEGADSANPFWLKAKSEAAAVKVKQINQLLFPRAPRKKIAARGPNGDEIRNEVPL